MYCVNCGEKINTKGKYCPCCGKQQNRRMIVKLTRFKPLYDNLASRYRKTIAPHHKKIKKFAPVATGVVAAALVMIFVIMPAYGQLMLEKGREYINHARYGEAVAAFSQAKAAGVSDPQLSSYLGEAYINLSEYEQAKKILENIKGDPTPAQLKLLADVWKFEGDEQMYESVLKELIKISPNDPYGYLKLSGHYRQNGFLDNAASILEKLLARQKDAQATAELYNIYLESYNKNTGAEKAASIKEEAMESLRSGSLFNLNIDEGTAISLSPKGEYIVLKSKGENTNNLDIYQLSDSVFTFHSSYKIPANYYVGTEEIAWAPSGDRLAFCNGRAEKYIYDSSIYIIDLTQRTLYNLSDPGADYIYYVGDSGIFIIDSLPCFSEDSKNVYFSRRSVKGNWLCVMDLEERKLTKLYEPAEGGYIDYKIIERNNNLYFSVRGDENNPLWGIYSFNEADGASKLKFPYDERYYFLALKDISPDGKYLMYHISTANQNNSIYIGIIDLETMKPRNIYPQVIDSHDSKMYALNKTDVFGSSRVFITKNAAFSPDSKYLYIAEDGIDVYGKLIRRFSLDNSDGDFVYLSFDPEKSQNFCAPNEEINGQNFAIVGQNKYLVYDNGLKLLIMER